MSEPTGLTTRTRIARAAVKGRFAVLFWLLVMAIALPVVVPDGPVIRRSMSLALFVVMLSGLNTISNRRLEFLVGLFLALPALVLNLAALALDRFELFVASELVYMAFFVYLAVHILRWTLDRKEVDVETIYGAVSVYLLMALAWGLAYYSILLTDPNAFHFPAEDELGLVQAPGVESLEQGAAQAPGRDWKAVSQGAQGTMMYYSFVTLTTLGYGDIMPVHPVARTFAYLEAVLGQLYVAVLIASLVGQHVAAASSRRER